MPHDGWVLVTGANRGLGYATAKSLVDAGESVIVGARSQAAGTSSSAQYDRLHHILAHCAVRPRCAVHTCVHYIHCQWH